MDLYTQFLVESQRASYDVERARAEVLGPLIRKPPRDHSLRIDTVARPLIISTGGGVVRWLRKRTPPHSKEAARSSVRPLTTAAAYGDSKNADNETSAATAVAASASGSTNLPI